MTRTTTWNEIGTNVAGSTNVINALEAAELNFNVEKAPLSADFNGHKIAVPKKVATIRDDTNEVLGIVGNDYSVCQNADAFDFINYVSNGLTFEKAGMTDSGMVYIITSLPEVSILSDSFKPHLIFQNSFNGMYPVKAAICPLRVVCQNQFALSFREAHNTVSIRHNASMADKIAAAKETFVETAKYMEELNKKAEILAAKPFTINEFKSFMDDILPVKADMSDVQVRRIEEARNTLWNAYMVDDNANFRGTAWGALNAVSDYLTHKQPARNTSTGANNKFMQVTFNPVLLQQIYSRVSA